MLYKFLRSKKGFTITELVFVVAILSILTAIAVPVFGSILKKQKLNDCKNQSTVISATVEQAMYGMMDSGKRQEKIIFSTGCKFSPEGESCFVLTQDDTCFTLGDLRGGYRDKINSQAEYPNSNRTAYDYNEGCAYDEDYINSLKAKGVADSDIPKEPRTNPDATCFLKKKHLEDTAFYTFLENSEYEPGQKIPVCPFADDENEYYYYVLEDGSVHCSNPECREAE